MSNKPRPKVAAPEWRFEAIGTQWYIAAPLSKGIQRQIERRIEAFDRTYSRFRSDSLVARIAEKAGTYRFPEDAAKLFDFYYRLYKATNGLCTPLIGQTLEQAGYDAEYSLQPKQVTHPPEWDDTMEFMPPKLTTHAPVTLDFGAAGKGYLVDIIGEVFESKGISGYFINAGGDVLSKGKETTMLLESPDDTSMALGQVKVLGGALCGSSGNRRKWGGFTHIINPHSLASPTDTRAVWVQAKSCMVADGLATALFFVSPRALLKEFDFAYAIIKEGNLEYSHNFNAEWYT
ncbi:MAG: FAD:protein FMN transferase [Candidatus Saccharimonadales bacterium]